MLAANELALVVVDTSAAYFETDDENNNMQALAHAKRLRETEPIAGRVDRPNLLSLYQQR